jgi:DeoR family fructose operon transcriptional repressor
MHENQTPLFAEERKREIVDLVNRNNKVTVPDLVQIFAVSPATIRNDLRDLQQAGLLKKTHGGAMKIDFPSVGFERESDLKSNDQMKQKQAIARKALEYIDDGDIIILDTGTTSLEIAKILNNKKNLTVVLNDIKIAGCLEECEGIQIILLGGTLRKKFHCTIGPIATKTLSDLSVDKVFLATNGLSVNKGCTTPDLHQAELKKIMAEVASQVIVLSDSTKIGVDSFAQFVSLAEIDVLITDSRINQELLEDLTSQGLEVVVADV